MPTKFLTLFAAMAYAAPVAPQGVMLKRQCLLDCGRDAVSLGRCLYKRVVALLGFVDPSGFRFN
jgi:hypothetical protein